MNLNEVEYYYIRNIQGDIIGIFDKTGTQVVSYSYDSWGKLIAIDGSLKDSVGVKNPYRYRGYRYDTETGLYYLQSRYYNAEWGRFINADGILGQTGQLLSHNVCCYCNNDPVNNKDDNGFMCSRATRMSDDSGSLPGFDYFKSGATGAASGLIDCGEEKLGNKVVKGKSSITRTTYKSSGAYARKNFNSLSEGKVIKYSKVGNAVRKSLGKIGTAGFTLFNMGKSIYNGEYVGAGIDLLSGLAGYGAGYLIGLGTAALITASIPFLVAGVIGIGGFALTVAAGMAIDRIASNVKDNYYRRR